MFGTNLVKLTRRLVLFAGVALVLAACASTPAVSGTTEEVSIERISVAGYGSASGVPDISTIQLGVNILDEDVGAAVAEANRVIERITVDVMDKGVAKEDVQTTNYSVWPEDRYDPQTGFPSDERVFHVDGMLMIKVRDVSNMGHILAVALEAGANNVYGINFGIEETSQLEAEARADAIEDARDRAQQLAQGLGVSLGKVLAISEGVPGVTPYYGPEAAYGVGGGGGAPVSPGQTSITIQVQVTFELVP
jgi:uncharacterized protein YggE